MNRSWATASQRGLQDLETPSFLWVMQDLYHQSATVGFRARYLGPSGVLASRPRLRVAPEAGRSDGSLSVEACSSGSSEPRAVLEKAQKSEPILIKAWLSAFQQQCSWKEPCPAAHEPSISVPHLP